MFNFFSMMDPDHGCPFKSDHSGAFVAVTSKNPTVLSGRSAHREMG